MLHRTVWPYAASIAALLLLWQLAAGWVDSRALPTPMAVLAVLQREVASGALPYHLAVTLARVAASFFLALLIGSAIGIAMGRSVLIDRLGDSWLIVFLNLPALVTIVLCYVWFGLTEAAAILAVTVNKIPNVVVTVREGARAISRDLLEMAQVFQLGRVRTLRHVVLPSLGPFIIAAARSGLAIVWKIVLVVELLGRSSGVGFQINLFFQLFDVAGILAYTIAFVAVIQLLELGVLQPLERRANRWRR
ncbi:ABC transporter permease [Vineibacter terrae]|uniref:ABC transporter permease n=1 Tax=Vineibacter terrae TaxID=2586908 RepID=UPI002E36A054|nr:ABC transporter permease [Vineibacter terrae]HEX2885244.1 ABC transporter permease [Vineibacter terrae]